MHYHDRRRFLTTTLAALGAASAMPRLSLADDEPKVYVCPPCGCPADGREFSEPGTCPVCGMPLVEKKDDTPLSHHHGMPKVAILVFDGVQIIDFAAPYEVFGQAHYDVFTVGATRTPVTTVMGLEVRPRYGFPDCPPSDVLLVPGGAIAGMLTRQPVLDWIRERHDGSRYTMSVCNGAFFLAQAGLLNGLEATTIYGAIEQLRALYPGVTVVSDRRFVDNGQLITTAGLSSGIDGALHVVSLLSGRGTAYDWKEDASYARASFADVHLHAVFGRGLTLELPGADEAQVESTQGDRTSWETVWLVTSGMTTADLLATIRSTIARRAVWTEEAVASTRASWSFLDQSGARWRAQLETHRRGDERRLSARLRIRLTA